MLRPGLQTRVTYLGSTQKIPPQDPPSSHASALRDAGASLSAFARRSAHRYTQVPAGVWELVQLVEVRLCLTSIVGTFPIPAGITSFGCPHILVYNDERRSVGTIVWVFIASYLKAGQFKVKPFAERSRSGQLASTPLSERSLLMLLTMNNHGEPRKSNDRL